MARTRHLCLVQKRELTTKPRDLADALYYKKLRYVSKHGFALPYLHASINYYLSSFLYRICEAESFAPDTKKD